MGMGKSLLVQEDSKTCKLFESSMYLTKNCSNCTLTKGWPLPDPNASPTSSNTNSETPKDPSMTFEDETFLDVSFIFMY